MRVQNSLPLKKMSGKKSTEMSKTCSENMAYAKGMDRNVTENKYNEVGADRMKTVDYILEKPV